MMNLRKSEEGWSSLLIGCLVKGRPNSKGGTNVRWQRGTLTVIGSLQDALAARVNFFPLFVMWLSPRVQNTVFRVLWTSPTFIPTIWSDWSIPVHLVARIAIDSCVLVLLFFLCPITVTLPLVLHWWPTQGVVKLWYPWQNRDHDYEDGMPLFRISS